MTTPRVIVVSGVPRSGKSTISGLLASKHGFSVICSDDIRHEYGVKWGSTDTREQMVNHAVHYRTLEHLMMGKDVVVDSTAMFREQREIFFDLCVHSLGKRMELDARKYLISLQVTDPVWTLRQLEAGRSPQQKAFYFDKFEPVSPEELKGLESYMCLDNNTASDLEHIKRELLQMFSSKPRTGDSGL